MQKKLTTRVIAFAAVLIAMNIVLSRFLAINVGAYIRLTPSQVPIILAGLWFGPAVGGICGAVGDLMGSIIQGYAPNVFITVSAILTGVLPALMKRYLFQDKINMWKLGLMLTVNGLVGSLGFTCLGLHLYYGTPYAALYAARPLQTLFSVIVNTLLTQMLFVSPLTAMVRHGGVQTERAK